MKYLIQLIIFYSLFTTILFAQKPFVLETDLLETIPPENLTFLEGVDHDVSFEVLEKAAGYKVEDKTNLTISLTEDGKQYGMKYEKFVPILVKALQELSAKNDALEARITTLEGA